MKFDIINADSTPPSKIHVVIEIAAESSPVKYEYNKEAAALYVDRIIGTSMAYPCNYGFVSETLSGDGDPLDVLVLTSYPLLPTSVIGARPIGVLLTEDEKGSDAKILAVPLQKIDPAYGHVNIYSDLPSIVLDRISHFFAHYKDLEAGKWVKIHGWEGVEEANRLIIEAIDHYTLNK